VLFRLDFYGITYSPPLGALTRPLAALAGPIGQSSGVVPPPAPVLRSPVWMAGLPGASHKQHCHLGHLLDLLQPLSSMEQQPLLVISAGGCTPVARLLLQLQRPSIALCRALYIRDFGLTI
jgi:hypothetical protein